MMGMTFSIYVGSLLTKTNRISRIFNRKLSDGAPSIFLNLKVGLLNSNTVTFSEGSRLCQEEQIMFL